MGSESLLLGQGQACTQSSSSFLSFLSLSITSPSILFFFRIPLSQSPPLLFSPAKMPTSSTQLSGSLH